MQNVFALSLSGMNQFPQITREDSAPLKPNLVRDIFERALEALKRMHAYTRSDHGRCGQFHDRSHALESRSGFYSQALTS